MTAITIHLPEERAKQLEERARELGVDLESLLLALINGASNGDSTNAYPRELSAGLAWGLARTDKPPPDDATVKRWLEERRIAKFGQGLNLSPETSEKHTE